MAQFSCRLPRWFNRCRFFSPEDASIGAVPLCRAKCPELGKRRMSPVRPMMIAAINGPIPNTSVTVVPDAVTAAAAGHQVDLGNYPLAQELAQRAIGDGMIL